MSHAPKDQLPSSASTRRRPAAITLVIGLIFILLGGGAAIAWSLRPAESPPVSPSPEAATSASTAPEVRLAPTPTPAGFPADRTAYELAALPQIDVFAVIPALAVDDEPFGSFTGSGVHAVDSPAPVFAAPGAPPVATLPVELPFDGTTVPVIEEQAHWLKVLLVGRQAIPSSGNPSQVMGWVRTQDVTVEPLEASVEVSLSARTVDIVRGEARERIASDFASGTEGTPTPTGRAFIMTTDVVPEYGYTRGHPIVYLSAQSPTLDGFGGANVAVTAFHYHDDRSGAISNGCIRVDPDAIAKLAALPYGTPVVVSQ